MSRIENVSRRGFLGGVFSASAFVLGAQLLPESAWGATSDIKATWTPNIWLGLEPDGTMTIIAHRSEMGTGIRTALPMVVADEAEADWKRVKVQQAIGDKKYGSQDTDGSCSIRDFYDVMREAGASARMMLVEAAAQMWNVPASECKASFHTVVHTKSKKTATYGQLASAAAKLPVPKKELLVYKTPAEYRYVGKEGIAPVDRRDLTVGKGMFGYDASRPGMLVAVVEHPPALGQKITSKDDAETLKVAGVKQTIVIDTIVPPVGFKALGGVAVLADNTWAAMQGRKKLKVAWSESSHSGFDTDAYRTQMIETSQKPGKVVRSGGDVDAVFAKSTNTHEAQYYTPLLAHASMEPPAALAEVKDGKAEVWACTQNPQAVQATVASAIGIKPEDVTCHVTLLGGGFGRKSKPDYAAEAAILSKQTGKPVKVIWTREDDIRFDYYHSTSAMYMKAALDAKGMPEAWLQRSVFPPIGSLFNADEQYGGEVSMGWTDVPYDIQNFRAENGRALAHVRIGWMRSVANVYHAFGVQSFTDELAAKAGRDPVEYFMELLGPKRTLDFSKQGVAGKPDPRFPFETGRLQNVVDVVASKSGWANRPKAGNGQAWGFAAHRSFFAYIAAVVQVKVDDKGQVRIPRVDIGIDCGRVIYPDRVRAQLEGAAVFGTSIAMLGEITAANGRVKQGNFNNFPVARMPEAPTETHVHLIASDATAAGVGEPGVPVIAPAIVNAIYAATGKRVRELPVRKTKLV